MWTKPYGKTGKDVSVIAFGGMRFPNPQDLGESAELVRYAFSKGVNYFDTAPYYCEDKSEDIMGTAFSSMPRESFFASTKCSDADGTKLRASLERSLKRLKLERIDFFHIWCLLRKGDLEERKRRGAIEAVQKAKDEGLVSHIVVSSHLDGEDNADVLSSGLFEGITIGYNALNFPFRQKTLDAALERKLGVVTMNPLGGGLIPRNAERFAFLKGPGDGSVVQAALRFNVSQPAISAALVGFSSIGEIDEALAAVEGFKPYSADHIEGLKSSITASFDGFCTGCGYCLPCPAELQIPKLMDAYNMKILENRDGAISERLKWHWSMKPEAASACTDCGQCEEECTQHLPIRERMRFIAARAD